VGNTALNELWKQGFPNYDAHGVAEAFGARFQPPPASQFRALPSGLMGPILLIPSSE
jgi:hypothetical protein